MGDYELRYITSDGVIIWDNSSYLHPDDFPTIEDEFNQDLNNDGIIGAPILDE